MRIVGWPSQSDADGALFPIDLIDVDLHATGDEIRAIATFLMQAAEKLDKAQTENKSLNIGIDLDNENPHADTGLSINVVHHGLES